MPASNDAGADASHRLDLLVHPARTRPITTVAVVAYLAIAAWTLGPLAAPALGVSIGAAVAVMMVILMALQARWFAPTRYRFDPQGIEVTFLGSRRYPWTRFRSWQRERGGYALSPFTHTRRFDHFRGLFLAVDHAIEPEVPNQEARDSAAPGNRLPRVADIHSAVQALLKERIDGRSVLPS